MSEPGDIDSLAAEYVLGTLDAAERAQAQALIRVDHALAAKVRIWERRLSELHLMVESIEPEDEIWDRIKRRIPRPPAPPPPSPPPPPEPEFVPPPVAAAVIAAEEEPAAPTLTPIAPPPAFAPATRFDQPLPKFERPSLESLEEAVLKAADALQQRASAEVKPEPVPLAEPEPAESVETDEPAPVETIEPETEADPDLALSEIESERAEPVVESQTEEAGERTEFVIAEFERTVDAFVDARGQITETSETGDVADVADAPATDADVPVAESMSDRNEPSAVTAADIREPAALPKGPLAAFPTPFTASPLTPPPAAPVPVPPATLSSVPPPVVPASPALAIRPNERREPPPPARAKSHWLARTVAPLAVLVLLALAALVAAWRYAPDRVPQPLRPVELLRAMGIAVPVTVVGPPPRKPAPPESQYDE